MFVILFLTGKLRQKLRTAGGSTGLCDTLAWESNYRHYEQDCTQSFMTYLPAPTKYIIHQLGSIVGCDHQGNFS